MSGAAGDVERAHEVVSPDEQVTKQQRLSIVNVGSHSDLIAQHPLSNHLHVTDHCAGDQNHKTSPRKPIDEVSSNNSDGLLGARYDGGELGRIQYMAAYATRPAVLGTSGLVLERFGRGSGTNSHITTAPARPTAPVATEPVPRVAVAVMTLSISGPPS